MKILYVVESLGVGGAEKVSILLANLFSRNEHEVTMLIINEPYTLKNELDKNVRLYFLERKQKFDLLKMLEFYKVANNFDLIHTHMTGAYRYAAFVKRTFFLSTPLVFHDHNGDIDLKPKVDIILKYFLKPKYYIAVSRVLLKWAVERLTISADASFVLENTVPRYTYNNSTVRNGRLILISNFRSTKNIEFAIHIAERLNYPMDIYGNINEPAYYETISNLVKKLNLSSKVRLITDSSNIRAVLNEYIAAIHTAKSESGPLVLLEYLNAGLPFITYRTGEVVEQIANEFPEMIMDNFNREEWVSKINYLIEIINDASRVRLSDLFEKEFSEEMYYKKCLDIYTKILN